MASQLRITGLATGLDIDTMVKQMMAAEKVKVDKLSQDRQVVQWRQDIYRELIGELNSFKSTYFDVLKPESYMLSTRNYSSFDIISTLKGAATTAVTATATSGAVAGDYSIRVLNLAEKAKVQGGSAVNAKEAPSKIQFPIKVDYNNDEFTVEGKTFTIAQRTYSSLSELASEINSKMGLDENKVDGVKLSDKVKAVVKDGQIRFDKKIAINTGSEPQNKDITVVIGGDSFDISLDSKGNYTLEELSSQINAKLTSAKAGEKAFDTKYRVSMEEVDGTDTQRLIVEKKNDDGTYTNVEESDTHTDVVFTGKTTITVDYASLSIEDSAPEDGVQPTFSDLNKSKNKLSYNKAFIKDVNDTISIKVGGRAAVPVSLYGVDVSSNDDNIIIDKIVEHLNTVKVDTNGDNDTTDEGDNLASLGIIVDKSIDGKLIFKAENNEQVTITGNGTVTLGLGKSFNVDQSIDDKMSNIIDGKVRFTINNVQFYYDFSKTSDEDTTYGKVIGAKNKSIRDVLSEISSKANVDISYSQLTRKFSITSKNTGSDETITAVDNGVPGVLEGENNKFLETLFGITNGINMGTAPLPEKYEFTIDALKDGDSLKLGISDNGTAEEESYIISGNDVKTRASDLANKINQSSDYYTATADEKGRIILTQKTASSTIVLDKDTSSIAFVKNTVYTPLSSETQIEDEGGNPITIPGGTVVIRKGEDAHVEIKEPNGGLAPIEVYRKANNFTIDGVNYTLNSETTESVTINLTSNPQKTFDKIKEFVDKYNEIIDKVNKKIFEKKQYDYKPLTDEQKKDMSEDDIKRWEEKAKQGLLSNDSMLSNLLYSMRNAFFEPVKDSSGGSIGITLSDIGITTSSDYSQRGKLIIDEGKLKDALRSKGDRVAELFTRTSTSEPSYNPNLSNDRRKVRTSEEGIFQRLSDILQDNLRTIRDNNGKKGILLEKAGIKGDFTEFQNLLTEDIKRRDKIIKEMTIKLADKENRYYLQFSKLETAMQKLNDQSNWLYQQLNSGR